MLTDKLVVNDGPEIGSLFLKSLSICDVKHINDALRSLYLSLQVLIPHKIDGVIDVGDLHVPECYGLDWIDVPTDGLNLQLVFEFV